MISDQVLLALIVAIPAVIASAIVPTAVLLINNKNARKIKQEDYAREDALEKRHTDRAEEVARLLKTNTEKQIETNTQTYGQLEQIHVLVNSNLTAEMEHRLSVMQAGLVSLLEIVELRKSLGQPERENTTLQIDLMQKEIVQLEEILVIRKKVTEEAAEKVKQRS